MVLLQIEDGGIRQSDGLAKTGIPGGRSSRQLQAGRNDNVIIMKSKQGPASFCCSSRLHPERNHD
jgi:hypothetical protein